MPKDDFRREVASRLKEARRERTLTQRQLADLGFSTQQNISRYEKGFIPDSWFLLARLHAEKAIDLNWLLGASVSASPAPGVVAGAGDGDAPADGLGDHAPARVVAITSDAGSGTSRAAVSLSGSDEALSALVAGAVQGQARPRAPGGDLAKLEPERGDRI